MVGLLPGGAEPAVEGDVEGVQRFLPAVAPALSAAAGGVEADHGEVEVLQRGLLGGEVAAGLDRAAEPGVERLDRVGNRYERPGATEPRPMPAAVVVGWAYGATVRDRGTGSGAGWEGRSCTLGWEPELIVGRPCDLPGCAA